MKLTLDIQIPGSTARATFLRDFQKLCEKHGRVEGRVSTDLDISLDLTLVSADQCSLTPIEQAIRDLEEIEGDT